MILREGYVRVTAGDHLGEIAMHNTEATWEARCLRGKESIGGGVSDQFANGIVVPGARSCFFDRIRQRDPRTRTHDIGQTMNPEWIAFPYKQREPPVL